MPAGVPAATRQCFKKLSQTGNAVAQTVSCKTEVNPCNPLGGEPMRVPPMSLISAALLLATSFAAFADDVPELNIDPVCRGIAQQAKGPGERGGPDLAFSQCVKSEQAMREKLGKEWPTFAPTDKAHCIGSENGGYASYTDLITCLEMARDARKMNE
jgi:hypothetical protein